jgi:hypothetical protein
VAKQKLPSQAAIRKAVSKLGPPTSDMLLDLNRLKATKDADALFRKEGISQKQIRSALAGISRAGTPQRFRNFTFTPSPTLPPLIPSFSKIINGIYEPVNSADSWVLPGRKYAYPTLDSPSNFGNGYANEKTGQLQTLQSVNLGKATESTFAAFYGQVDTGGSSLWQSGTLTFQAVISWKVHNSIFSTIDWVKRLDGFVSFDSAAWLVVLVYNQITGDFQRIPGISGTRIPLYSTAWYVNELADEYGSGTVDQALATVQFTITNSPRIYLIGVQCEGTAKHSIRNVDGGPLPPAGNNFIAYSETDLTIPYMYLTD